jgi:hypothetical protein
MYSGVAAITRSRWFQRMWVTLEYLQSNRVFILTKDWVIFHADAASLASKMRGNYRWDDHVARQELQRVRYNHPMAISWADMQAVKCPRGNHPTIGDAISILGSKKSRDFGDYFIALAAMMGIPQATGPSEELDGSGRFHRLAVESLRRGDSAGNKETPAGTTYDTIRIARLLEAHIIPRAHLGAEGLSNNVSDMISEMGLDRPSRGSGRSRFQIALGDALSFRKNATNGGIMDRLAQVGCPCGRRYLFRLVCWDPAKLASAELYRIPGLFLDASVDNGVGIVMGGVERIGHMIFGTPACDCGPNLRRVYIGPEFLS